jgi:hypothetical protein
MTQDNNEAHNKREALKAILGKLNDIEAMTDFMTLDHLETLYDKLQNIYLTTLLEESLDVDGFIAFEDRFIKMCVDKKNARLRPNDKKEGSP